MMIQRTLIRRNAGADFDLSDCIRLSEEDFHEFPFLQQRQEALTPAP